MIGSRIFRWLLVAATLLAVGLASAGAAAGTQPLPVTVLYFNDLHGHLQPFSVRTATGKAEVGGVARLAAVVKAVRRENDARGAKTFLLVAGDMLQGTPLSTVFKGQADLEIYRRLGVDAMTVGNHEFDFGLDNFLSLQRKAAFPFLSANVRWKDSGRLLSRPFVRLPLTEGVDLTVVGVTTAELKTTTLPAHVARLSVTDPVDAVRRAAAEAGGRGPLLVLSHCRHATDRKIARALPQATAIIGGHDQVLLSPYRRVGGVPIFQAFEKGRYLGRLDLQVDPITGRARMVGHRYITIDADITPDGPVAAIVADYDTRLGKRFKTVVGHAAVLLDAERERVRYQETTMGNFVTDLMRRYTGAEAALLNGGSLRASIDAGAVTLDDVFKAMPFANEIVVVTLSGADLQAALTRSLQAPREDEFGGFLHLSGLWVVQKESQTPAISVGPDRQPLDSRRRYRVAITDFLAAGGDGYSVFKNQSSTDTGLPLRELLVDAFRQGAPVSAVVEGRIRRVRR